MQGSKREVIRISDTEHAEGRIVLVEPGQETEKDIVQKYLDGELSKEMNDAVELASRISRGLQDAFPAIRPTQTGDVIMKIACALGKPLPDELCVTDITKYFYRPLLNTIYLAVCKGRLKVEGDHKQEE